MKRKAKFRVGEIVCLYRGTADRYGKITALLKEHAWVRFRRNPLLSLKVPYGFLTSRTKRERSDAAEKLAQAVDAYLKNASSDQQFDYMQEMEDANCAFKEAAK